MAMTATPTVGRDVQPRTWRSVLVLWVSLTIGVAMYVVGMLVPYYVNDLDALPLAELTSGAHDPEDLWPHGMGGPVGVLMQVAGVFALVVTPILLLVVGGISVTAAVQEWRTSAAARRAPGPVAFVVLTLVCLALLAWFLTPVASALVTWRLD